MNKHEIHKNRKENWETPPEIFQPLNNHYRFTIDLAACAANRKVARFVGPDGGGLHSDFLALSASDLIYEMCWINPPYGKFLKPFTEHIALLAGYGIKIVALLPMSLDTGWFWNNVYPHAELYGRRGRIQFLPRRKSGNPSGSLLATFNLHEPSYLTGWRGL